MNDEKKEKDFWDKLNIMRKLIVAITVSIISYFVTSSITTQQSAVPAIEFATRILSEPLCDDKRIEAGTSCRDKAKDDFARFIIEEYTNYPYPENSPPVPVIGGTARVFEMCHSACQENPEGSLCKNHCGPGYQSGS